MTPDEFKRAAEGAPLWEEQERATELRHFAELRQAQRLLGPSTPARLTPAGEAAYRALFDEKRPTDARPRPVLLEAILAPRGER